MKPAVRIALAWVFACALLLAGCNGDGSLGPTDEERSSGELVMPSLTREENGTATAVGTLAYRRDLGGVFVVVDITPEQTPTTDARVIAVLTQSKNQTSGADLGPLVGSYCAFTGNLVEEKETTATATAPLLDVESYRILKMP